MRAAVISLPRRRDRRAAFTRYATAADLEWDFLDAVDEDPPTSWRWSRGAWGCAQSHLQALSAGYELIFEDDAAVPEQFQCQLAGAQAELPEDWELLKLGAQHRTGPVGFSPHLVKCSAAMRTHAYLVSAAARAELIEILGAGERHWDLAFAGYDRRGHSYALRVPVPVYASASDIADSTPHRAGMRRG